jgi:tetratricopeptide (TPR) repeat protein
MDRPRILWYGFLVLWAFTLLVYGAVAPWAVAVTAVAMSALYVASLILLPEPLKLSRAAVWFLAAMAALFLLQLLPLGAVLFPYTHRLRVSYGVGGFWPGTADTWRTLLFIAQFSIYVMAALFVLKLRQAGLPGSFLVKTSLAVIGLEAAWGIVRVFLNVPWIPFYDGPRSAPDIASGTLVGRNNFAGLLATGLVLAAGLAWARFTWPPRRAEDSGAPRWPQRLEAGLGWGLLAALFAVGIVLSKSRGGALAAGAGLLLLPFFYRGRASAVGAALIVVIGAGAFVIANPSGLLSRFSELDPFELSADARWKIFATTVSAGLTHPLLGFGFGTHPVAYHPFQPPTLQGQIHHAHNEYANVFFESGLVGLGLLVAGLAVWFSRAWRGLKGLPSPDRLPYAAAVSGGAVLALHSLVDMDLRITSLGLALAIVVGVVGSLVRKGESRVAAGWLPAPLALASVACFLLVSRDPAPRIEAALAQSPADAERTALSILSVSPYEFRAARVLAASAQARGEVAAADRWFEKASDLWPAHPGLQRDAGFWFWDRGDLARSGKAFHRLFAQQPGAVSGVMEELWDPARKLEDFEAVVPRDARAYAAFASFLVRRGRWEDAAKVFERGCPVVAENAACFDEFADALSSVGQWGLEAVVRDRRLELRTDAAGCAAAARAWSKLGAHDQALRHATAATRMDPAGPLWFALKAEVLGAKGDRLEAIECWTEALSLSGSDSSWRLNRAALYTALDMHAAAADDYQWLFRLRPSDRGILLALSRSLVASGQKEVAASLLDRYLSEKPDDSEVVNQRKGLKP